MINDQWLLHFNDPVINNFINFVPLLTYVPNHGPIIIAVRAVDPHRFLNDLRFHDDRKRLLSLVGKVVLTTFVCLLVNYVDFFLCFSYVRGLRNDTASRNLQKRLGYVIFLHSKRLGARLRGRGLLQGLKGCLLHETGLGFQLQLGLFWDQDLVHVYHFCFYGFQSFEICAWNSRYWVFVYVV